MPLKTVNRVAESSVSRQSVPNSRRCHRETARRKCCPIGLGTAIAAEHRKIAVTTGLKSEAATIHSDTVGTGLHVDWVL